MMLRSETVKILADPECWLSEKNLEQASNEDVTVV